MAAFTRPEGGTVVNAGVIDWTFGLKHGDPLVERITRTVLDRLGADADGSPPARMALSDEGLARPRRLLVGLMTIGVAVAPTLPVSASSTRTAIEPHVDPDAGIMNLDHLIFIVQENRSFDSYFGTFPGADGLSRAHGRFSAPASPTPRPITVSVRITTRTCSIEAGRTTIAAPDIDR